MDDLVKHSQTSEFERRQDLILVSDGDGGYFCAKSRTSQPIDVIVTMGKNGAIGIKGY